MKQNSRLMTEGVIWKQLLWFAMPLLIGNLFQQLYNAVDSIIVGNYVGSSALAAVGASTPIINLLIGFFMGIATGAGIIIAQYFGGKDYEKLHQTIHTALAVSLIAGVFLTFFGVAFSPLILRLTGTPADILDQSVLYLRIYFMGSIFVLLYNMGAGILRAVGDSKRPLYYLCISSVINIILDLIFVLYFNMGVVGVALATLIAQGCSAILLFYQLIKCNEVYGIKIKSICVHKEVLLQIVKVGIPTGLQQVIISFSNVVVQSSINSFGAFAVAGCSTYIKLDGFIILPIMSFAMASTTFTGQNVGAGQYERVKKGLKTSLGLTSIYTLMVSVLMWFFGAHMLTIFTKEVDVLYYGEYMLKTLAPAYIFLAIMQNLVGIVRGAGKTIEPMLISIFSMCVIRILWINIGLYFIQDIRVVFLGYPVTWAIGMGMMVLYAWKGKWLQRT